jgi:hypothetical protein
MIQLNNVSSALSSTGNGAVSNSIDPSSLDSFENALSDAVTQTLQKFGINPNNVNISIAAAAPKAGASSDSNPTAAPVAASPSSLAALMTGAASSTTPPLPAAPKNQPAEDPVQSFDDKYWAKQPAAVQTLRSTEDFDQRTQMAMQLAQQGYTIDVPIMVWGWDPSQVTSSRQSYGYTWVPSALQNPIESAPGINMQGMQAYDPNNPPAGSIAV